MQIYRWRLLSKRVKYKQQIYRWSLADRSSWTGWFCPRRWRHCDMDYSHTRCGSVHTLHLPLYHTSRVKNESFRKSYFCVFKVTWLLLTAYSLLTGWWRSIVVRTSVLAGGLSLSCARLMDGCLTTLWVRRPLSVNQQGQLSLPSLRRRLNE